MKPAPRHPDFPIGRVCMICGRGGMPRPRSEQQDRPDWDALSEFAKVVKKKQRERA